MLVAFEGIDGSGKTTTAPLVAERLRDRGYKVVPMTKRRPRVTDPFAQAQLEALAVRLWGIPHDERMRSVGTAHWVYLNAAYFSGLYDALSAEPTSTIFLMDNWINKLLARLAANGEITEQKALDFSAEITQPDVTVFLHVDPLVAARRKEAPSPAEQGALSARADATFTSHQLKVQELLQTLATRRGWLDVAPHPSDDAHAVADAIVHALTDNASLASAPRIHAGVRRG